ncbi:MAG: sugar-binding domain-containing protein [Pirellulales bacterium]
MNTHFTYFPLLCFIASASLADETVVDAWRYTFSKPAENWYASDFDDRGWKQGTGGFGTPQTPGARVGTQWQTDNIWLRKAFVLASVPANPALLVHHDEDAEVYLNGRRVASLHGWSTKYELHSLTAEQASALKVGANVLAVHCRQTDGGQFIDAHIVDADRVPELPEPKRGTEPFKSALITRWGAEVTADNAWTEYPRPQLVRDNWQCLNGHWDYAIAPIETRQRPNKWAGQILVPFALESRLGGVQRLLDRSEALWYRRTFQATPENGRRTLLHFEAVDYRCDVFVNDRHVGSHQGGNTPFSFDVTEALGGDVSELVVRVEDETEAWQLRGKQVLNPHGIWYTQMSGIWQAVWLEEVAAMHMEDLSITTDAAQGSITVRGNVTGDSAGAKLHVVAKDAERVVAESTGDVAGVTLKVDDPKLWSPKSPHLYDLEVALVGAQGLVLDEVRSYAGIRTVGKARDAAGHLRFTLNGEPIFHFGPLDQGWWPDGLLTPPSDEAMLFDIEFLKAAGFNMIRKHIKVEPRRYYYHCDRLGMMVWQDQVSGGKNPRWTFLKPNPSDADWPDAEHEQFLREFEWMVDNLENHPSIVVWTPFNEAWGQHRTQEVGQWIAKRDPTRLVNIASGGNFWPAGDVVDFHGYPHPSFPFDANRFADYVQVVGEFGGHGLPVAGHLWDANRRNWGYGNLPKDADEYQSRYRESLSRLNDLRQRGIAAGVYTQTTDVEGEINGLVTYNREVIKIPAEELARLHQVLFTDDQPQQPEVSTAPKAAK